MKTLNRFPVVILIALLVSAACSQSQILSSLRGVVIAAEMALPILGPASGLPPSTIITAGRWLQGVGKAAAEWSDILAGPGSAAEKSARIAQAGAAIAKGCNCIAPGAPTQFVNVMNAVSSAVLKFLGYFPAPGPLTAAARPVPEIVIKPADNKELAELRQRSEAIIGAIERKGLK